jgi:hypothetical protein
MGKYEGSVDTNGYAHGQTYDGKTPTSSAAWDSDVPLVCATPEPAAQTPARAPLPQGPPPKPRVALPDLPPPLP